MFGFTQLHLLGTEIILMERLQVCVSAVQFITTLKLARRTLQRMAFAVISCATQNLGTRFG
jgi:hypothetical protein